MTVCLDNDYIRAVHEEKDCLSITYKKFMPSKVFRDAWMQMAEFIIEKKLYKYLTDARGMTVVSPSDQKWFTDEIAPSIFEKFPVGAYIAFVLSESVFAQLSVTDVVGTIQKKEGDVISSVKYFDNLDEAKQWILSV